MTRAGLAFLTLAVALVTGCVPIRVAWIDWPDVEGRAIDVTTGKPIAGAAVTIHAASADFEATTTTSADGTFHFPEHERDQWVPYQFNNIFPAALITVSAPGYDRFENRLDGSMSVEAIPLTPTR